MSDDTPTLTADDTDAMHDPQDCIDALLQMIENQRHHLTTDQYCDLLEELLDHVEQLAAAARS